MLPVVLKNTGMSVGVDSYQRVSMQAVKPLYPMC